MHEFVLGMFSLIAMVIFLKTTDFSKKKHTYKTRTAYGWKTRTQDNFPGWLMKLFLYLFCAAFLANIVAPNG